MITLARLKELLEYNPETGRWKWRVRGRGRRLDGRAGCIHPGSKRSAPYRRIRVDGKIYTASRLAWFYMTGGWPFDEIDHIDRNSLNDCWKNLRQVTRCGNEWNKGAYKNNKLGLKGVRLHQGAFYASIRRNGVRVHLGTFATAEQAAAAYRSADVNQP